MWMKWNNISRINVLAFLFFLSSFQLQADDNASNSIKIAAPLSSPFVFESAQGKPQGFLVELFSLVEQETGLKVNISIMPWARGIHEVKVGHLDALMPTIYTDERAEYLVYPNIPLVEFHTVLLKRAEDEIVVDDITQLGTEKVIVKIRAMSMGKVFDDAEKAGLINVIEVRDFDHAIQMLASSRADLVACVDYISNSSLRRLNLNDKIEAIKFSNDKVSAFLAFSKPFAKKNDVNEIMQRVNKIKNTKSYQALVEKFLK